MVKLLATALLLQIQLFGFSQDSSEHYATLANQHIQNKLFKKAEISLLKAKSFTASNADIDLLLANLYINQLSNTAKAIELLKPLTVAENLNNEAVCLLTIIYLRSKKWKEALPLALKAKASFNLNPNLAIGRCNLMLENLIEAEKYLKLVLKQEPDNPQANEYYGTCLQKMGKETESLKYTEKAVMLDSTKAYEATYLGISYFNNKQYKKAAEVLTLAAQRGQNSLDFKEVYALALMADGQWEKGEHIYNDIIKNKPDNDEVIFNAAEVCMAVNNYARAFDYYTYLVGKNAKNAKALYYQGYCLIKTGDRQRGEAICDTAIKMDPSLQSLRQKKGLF
jgi:Flp pilus assembly protein TadD